jgi:hypothetical protein
MSRRLPGSRRTHLFCQDSILELLAGTKAERLFYPDAPPLLADHDVKEAAAFSGVICSSPEAVDAYLAFARIEAQAILRQHQHVLIALANALKVRRSLDARDLDEVIAIAAKAAADESQRRRDRKRIEESAARFSTR